MDYTEAAAKEWFAGTRKYAEDSRNWSSYAASLQKSALAHVEAAEVKLAAIIRKHVDAELDKVKVLPLSHNCTEVVASCPACITLNTCPDHGPSQ